MIVKCPSCGRTYKSWTVEPCDVDDVGHVWGYTDGRYGSSFHFANDYKYFQCRHCGFLGWHKEAIVDSSSKECRSDGRWAWAYERAPTPKALLRWAKASAQPHESLAHRLEAWRLSNDFTRDTCDFCKTPLSWRRKWWTDNLQAIIDIIASFRPGIDHSIDMVMTAVMDYDSPIRSLEGGPVPLWALKLRLLSECYRELGMFRESARVIDECPNDWQAVEENHLCLHVECVRHLTRHRNPFVQRIANRFPIAP